MLSSFSTELTQQKNINILLCTNPFMPKKEEDYPKIISNFEVDNANNKVVIFINPKIFSVESINKAASLFKDYAWVSVDGDPSAEILVELKPKGDKELESLAREFNSRLIDISTEGIKADENNRDLISKIKNVITAFKAEEKGRITKESIVTIGAILASLGLSS